MPACLPAMHALEANDHKPWGSGLTTAHLRPVRQELVEGPRYAARQRDKRTNRGRFTRAAIAKHPYAADAWIDRGDHDGEPHYSCPTFAENGNTAGMIIRPGENRVREGTRATTRLGKFPACAAPL